jgi:hypothetical protein
MIQVALEDQKAKSILESIRHADLKTAVLNAPWRIYKDVQMLKIEDFLDSETLAELKKYSKTQPKTQDPKKSKSAVWSAAGHACVKQYEDLK